MGAVRLILASQSPRRAALLRQAGYGDFVIAPVAAAELPLPRSAARASFDKLASLVCDVAMHKAKAAVASGRYGASDVILTADTIVRTASGELLGQPTDADDARRMLELLMNATHHAVTCAVLIDGRALRSERVSDVAAVRFGAISEAALESYATSGAWVGKAGGYNLAEVGKLWTVTVESDGDATTVVGLPMRKLVPVLERWGVTRPGREPPTAPEATERGGR